MNSRPDESSPSRETSSHHSAALAGVGLALEVIGREGSVARIESGRITHAENLPPETRATASLTPALQRLLDQHSHGNGEKAGKSSDESPPVDFVAVANGPGSFTGLRIAAATAKTLAYAWGIPVVTIDSLSVLANAIESSELEPETAPELLVGLDAYRGQTFAASFRLTLAKSSRPIWKLNGPIELLSRPAWLDRLKATPTKSLITGDAVKEDLPIDHLKHFPPTEIYAETLARIAEPKFQAGDVTDPMSVLPEYFRPSAAEEKASANQATNPSPTKP
ncbi:tRNA (adenosine(37)-N6)-threonylcarbamoyltransferase complex dimerization subunit type 1 TsaB [Rhodopirellula halodulae]|uniref:tRNA (adenosine(37)-N6)-threonylcarbamoyltransferase complex dimerization subunit type 1 TsaB n=1 Tax=Rhodopirellula halodulae TaxID=2894198 RepID=UPI001E3CE73A|nr:tRNA (adenosine(37)-N6)-threonylcarbamoyltransferase complex dimerization subunit type 1 TsaB [Rhodopirellula sp. JC737]MCC9656145.1 tRNA (adenosine(37)-N6)-threonylcarbamoyltransferase complex dimerization subunit type 1 TsaB [Rhodopirellula sp. JC737]